MFSTLLWDEAWGRQRKEALQKRQWQGHCQAYKDAFTASLGALPSSDAVLCLFCPFEDSIDSAVDMITPLFLLAIANGTPVLAALLLKDWGNIPVDRGFSLPDGYPLFGPSKTVRGIGFAIIATTLVAPVFNFSLATGALFGFWAMVGDLLSSFTKRRCGFTSSYNAPGLDHIPESFLPLWLLRSELGISWSEIAVIVLAFALLDLLLWHLLYRFYPRLQSREQESAQ